MKNQFEPNSANGRFTCIMFDPLSYIHPRRLQLPDSFDTPSHRSVINRLLLDALPEASDGLTTERHSQEPRLLRHWSSWPQVSTLIGAQILKSDLAWRGRLLGLSATVRSFIGLPFQPLIPAMQRQSTSVDGGRCTGFSVWNDADDPLCQVQGVGLSCLLDWQRNAPTALVGRLRLMFAPELDWYFDKPRRDAHRDELFLISQALHYAKNHPNYA